MKRLGSRHPLQGRGWGWVRRRRPTLGAAGESRCARLPTPYRSLPGRGIILAVVLSLFAGDLAVAQQPPTLAEAQKEAAIAKRRSDLLERQAQRATGEAARANAAAAALAA
ncbi:MAG: hypothetical protein ACXWU4_00290, partial [Allosphingosinicella sp.]